MDFIHSSEYFVDGCIPVYVSTFSHNTAIRTHTHDFFEFVYVEKGFAAHMLNNTISVLLPGDLFGLRPGDFHGYYNVHDTIIYNCLFQKEALSDCLHEVKSLPGIMDILNDSCPSRNVRIQLEVSQRHEMSNLLKNMQHECTHHETGWETKLKAHLMELLVLASRGYESMRRKISEIEYKNTENILSTIKYIEENFSKNIKIKELSDMAGLNRDYYTKVFKTLCGVTPSEFILYIRISKSVELIMRTGLLISQVSGMVGFDDPNYFARIFKKVTGMTPTDCRSGLSKTM